MKPLYIYDKEQLAFKRVSLKSLLVLPVVFVLSVLFNYFYFYAPLIEDTDWKGEKVELTVEEYMNNYMTEKNYGDNR